MDESNSKYEWIMAAPSNAILTRMYTGWSVIALVCGTFGFMVFVAMLAKRTVRENAFNVYIMAVTLPDFLPAIICGIDCALKATGKWYTLPFGCNFQSFYTGFNVSCNSWLNGLICWEIYRLLQCSRRRERYFPPTTKIVLKKCAFVTIWSALISTMPLWPVNWILITTDPVTCVSLFVCLLVCS